MIITKPLRALTVPAAGLLVWAFVGLERLVGDHEVGVIWEPFLKHRATLQMRFMNPAQKGLEILPFEKLSEDEKRQFLEFCDIRYGVQDPSKCYVLSVARQV